ncbi:MAG: phage tail protein I [Aeromonadaceae bacterium]
MTENENPSWAKAPLLPYCSSGLERDLDAALSHIETIEIPIRDLWNPWKCPLEMLPYLAWALSVDQWESAWSEDVKRRVIAASLDVHRIKGTRPAIEMALEALGVKCQLTEWFELPDGEMKRGTFAVVAWINDNMFTDGGPVITDRLYGSIVEAINRVRPASRSFSMKVGVMFTPHNIRLGGAITSLSAIARVEASAEQESPKMAAQLGVGSALSAKSIASTSSTASLGVVVTGGIMRVGAVARSATFVSARMECKSG